MTRPTLPGLAAERVLCRLEDIPDGGAKGFPGPPGSLAGLFAVRRGARVFVYENVCPHIGTSLNLQPDKFLGTDGTLVICVTHGATFRVEDGVCVSGPCQGDRLTGVAARVDEGGMIWLG